MSFVLLLQAIPEEFEEYETEKITAIVLEQSRLLFSREPPNYMLELESHKFNSTLENAYSYAAVSFLAALENLYGIGQERDHEQGLFLLQQAHRYGCNEASLLLADGHMRGKYGLAKSEALAFGYYKEVSKGFLAGILDGDSYQYQYNKYYLDLFLKGMDKTIIDKSEREYMLVNFLNRQDPNMATTGNVIGMGAYTGSFGFAESEEDAARFTFLAAADNVSIPMKADLNSYDQMLKHIEGESKQARDLGEDLPRDDKQPKIGVFDRFKRFLAKFEILDDGGAMESGIEPGIGSTDMPGNFSKMAGDFVYDGINLLEFKDVLPFTPNAYLDALIRLAKEVCWDIYEDYKHFELFSELGDNPTKNEVYDLLLTTDSNLVMEAATIFIERTDSIATLSHLRAQLDNLRGDEADYVEAMTQNQQFTRSLSETCQRKGQNFAILAVLLTKGVLIPQEYVDSLENKDLARILSLASIYHGCHMGLTSLGFWAVEGYRPGNVTKYPNLNAALVAFDIASQAGSFESSYYESLILAHKVSAYYTRLRKSILFYFDQNFISEHKDKFNPYQGIPKMLYLAASLAEHAAHAGFLEGRILKADLDYELGRKYQACQEMRRAAYAVAVDEFLQLDERNIQRNFVFAFFGEETALYNNLREYSRLDFPLCYETRQNESECIANGAIYLLLELAHGHMNPGVQMESSKLCARHGSLCANAMFGFSEDYVEQNEQQVLTFLEDFIRKDAMDWAETFLYARGVFNRRIKPRKINLDVAKAYFVDKVVERSNRLEEIVNKCFYEPFEHYSEFSECLGLHYLLSQLSGAYIREILATQMYDDYMMEHTREMLEKYVQLYNSFAFNLAFKYSSLELARLINIDTRKIADLRDVDRTQDNFEFLAEFVAQDELSRGFEHAQAMMDQFNGVGETRHFTLTVNGQVSEKRSEWIPQREKAHVLADFAELDSIEQMFFVETLSFAALSVFDHARSILYSILGFLGFKLISAIIRRPWRISKAKPAEAELDEIFGDFEFAGGFENDTGK